MNVINQDYYYGIRDKALREYARRAVSALESCEDWAGRYAGNVFLIVLNNSDFEDASRIAENIKERFADVLYGSDKNEVRISLKYSVKTCSEDINDADSMIKLASVDLHYDMNYYKRFKNLKK